MEKKLEKEHLDKENKKRAHSIIILGKLTPKIGSANN